MFHERLQTIVTALTEALEDASKFDSGVDAAGRRVLAAAQLAKNDIQQLRLDIQSQRNNRKS